MNRVLTAVLAALLAVCGGSVAAPASVAAGCAPGTHELRVGDGRSAYLRVSPGGKGGKKALIVVLHGAGGSSRDGLYAFRGGWSTAGLVMVAPASMGSTWSSLHGSDADLPTIDRALRRVLARCEIDRKRVAIGGFSDGGTYALSLGLANGKLFKAIIALSPGGVRAERYVGKPRVFVAHGTRDDVLPISRTSDAIVRALRGAGYPVTYRKFQGGHEAPEVISRAAVRWFLRG